MYSIKLKRISPEHKIGILDHDIEYEFFDYGVPNLPDIFATNIGPHSSYINQFIKGIIDIENSNLINDPCMGLEVTLQLQSSSSSSSSSSSLQQQQQPIIPFDDEFFQILSNMFNNSSEGAIASTAPATIAPITSDILKEKLGPYQKINNNHQLIQEQEKCSICSTVYKENEGIRQLSCNHSYHKKCIDRWFIVGQANTCPICRQNSF